MDVKTKIITQFVRDLSFENPNGPGSFQTGSDRPTVNANVDVKAQNRKDTNIYEVELNVSVNASRADQSLYIVIKILSPYSLKDYFNFYLLVKYFSQN